MIINNAAVYSDGVQESLVYEVTLETGQMPDAQMSSVSLFVDSGADTEAYVQVCSSAGACTRVEDQEDFTLAVAALDYRADGAYVTVPLVWNGPDILVWPGQNLCLDVDPYSSIWNTSADWVEFFNTNKYR